MKCQRRKSVWSIVSNYIVIYILLYSQLYFTIQSITFYNYILQLYFTSVFYAGSVYMSWYVCVYRCMCIYVYWVATIIWLLKNKGLFCEIALQKRSIFRPRIEKSHSCWPHKRIIWVFKKSAKSFG